MKILHGDIVARIEKDTDGLCDIFTGTITDLEQDWVPLFKIVWDDGQIWRVTEEVAIELRNIFLDNIEHT